MGQCRLQPRDFGSEIFSGHIMTQNRHGPGHRPAGGTGRAGPAYVSPTLGWTEQADNSTTS